MKQMATAETTPDGTPEEAHYVLTVPGFNLLSKHHYALVRFNYAPPMDPSNQPEFYCCCDVENQKCVVVKTKAAEGLETCSKSSWTAKYLPILEYVTSENPTEP